MKKSTKKCVSHKAWAIYTEDGDIWGAGVRLPIWIRKAELLKNFSYQTMDINMPKLHIQRVEIRPLTNRSKERRRPSNA